MDNQGTHVRHWIAERGGSLLRQQVSSSSIEWIGYDAATAVLQVQFIEGALYEYFMVPHSTYTGFAKAKSKGRFFAEFVRGKYQFRKI